MNITQQAYLDMLIALKSVAALRKHLDGNGRIVLLPDSDVMLAVAKAIASAEAESWRD